jgi:hypothetical protein
MEGYVPDVGIERAYADIRTHINSTALLFPREEPPHDVLE